VLGPCLVALVESSRKLMSMLGRNNLDSFTGFAGFTDTGLEVDSDNTRK